MTNLKIINECIIGIKNQSRYLFDKNKCGETENLIYMAEELKKHFEKLKIDLLKKKEIIITLIENI